MRLLLVVALPWLAACADRGQSVEEPRALAIRLSAVADQVEFGKGFELIVERTWPQDCEPLPFEESQLEPLHLEFEGRERTPSAGWVSEVSRYRAYVFGRGEVRVPAALFAVRQPDSTIRQVESNSLDLQVGSSLASAPPGASGIVESPRLLQLPERASRWYWVLAGALCALVAVVLLRWRKPTVQAEPVATPTTSIGDEVLARLAALGGQRPGDWVEVQRFYVEITSAVRDYLASGRVLRAREMTTEELEQACPDQVLARCLRHCDLVKFAHVQPTDAERSAAVDEAVAFVRAQELS